METRTAWKQRGKVKAEEACVFFQGREFCAGGAVVSPDFVVGYPKAGKLLSWGGETLGTCRVVSSWPVRIIGSRMFQIEATVNGIRYTGRGFGDGCLYRGRRKR